MFAPSALAVCAAILTSTLSLAAEEKRDGPPIVTYREERLSVQAHAAPLPDVLAAVGRATGAELRGHPADAAPVTLTVTGVPVKEALQRILGAQSFALVFADDGRLRVIDLRGGPQAAPVRARPAEPPAGWTPSEETVQFAQVVDRWAQSDTRYPVSGRLAKALGADEATFSQIGEAALTNPDRGVRAKALRTSLKLLEANEEVRDAFVQMLGTLDDAFLTNYVRIAMKDNASEIMGGMARQASTPAVRTRAQMLLRELRSTPEGP